ncbi:S-adenosyl-L-methionine-dependent methyltransferase [Micractinium conductrix]|uniref:S-adenosyl-L-methionine-dependent methyltransferase n=1 Tax=Micractinium conductrix TaxID=554055 RepID=A0A2P6VS64_9CHLO|nr:S-adenosyl-L-methionine-dependent methyltransferase [Micractinium conductrix]|eukprot:PSC76936.1 S-adenosyl-L-methionine-dependent methyltransferase [Micractinium conductrix]
MHGGALVSAAAALAPPAAPACRRQRQWRHDGRPAAPRCCQRRRACAAAAAALPDLSADAAATREALATRFLDEQLLRAVTIVNMERDLTQEYNQVVLVGDALDTRPFRLPWPEGTVMFCVAPQAAHAAADAAFKAQGARVPRGCLLRRVPAELGQLEEGGGGFVSALERAGFRGERLSVWVLQGVAGLGLGPAGLTALLTDLCNLAAFDSLVAGLMPALERRALDNLLASFGLLGAGVDFGPQTDWGRWEPGLALDSAGARPWLFVAQQKRLSLAEMGTYEDHVAAAEEVGEDNFFGNFS